MICEECMQRNPDCFCITHKISSKYIDLVSGCIHIDKKTNKRCKAPRNILNGTELYVCKKHTTPIPDKYQKILDSFSDKK